MIRGLYTAASGMACQQTIQDIISNNMANVDTTGYKKDIFIKGSFPSLLLKRMGDKADLSQGVAMGRLGTGAAIRSTTMDFSMGALKSTENPFDLAINGKGFFVIQTPGGEKYTKDGSFTLNSEGKLVTKDGFAVMGQYGPINLTSQDAHFNENGGVVVDGVVVDTLKIVSVDNPGFLTKAGKNLFVLKSGFEVQPVDNPQIIQGYLEDSNVNVVNEMTNMIWGMRLYEANQRLVHLQDESLGRLINEAGRI